MSGTRALTVGMKSSESDALITSSSHVNTLKEIYARYSSSDVGLSSDEAKKARLIYSLNNIPPPISAPAWLCCLLPCLLRTRSMEQYHDCVPEYAFVMRNKRWVKMDSASIVPGDVIRVECGERVCADCRVIEANKCVFETSYVHGNLNPLNCDPNSVGENCSYLTSPNMAFLGYLCLSGSCTCIVVATGGSAVVSRLILQNKWPPKRD
jgi:hypothetical protein